MAAQTYEMQPIKTIIDLTLQNNRQITILEKRVELARGEIIGAKSPFDPLLTFQASKDQYYIPKTLDQRLNISDNWVSPYSKANPLSYTLAYSQKFRTGTIINPSFSFINFGKDSLYYSLANDELRGLYTNRANIGLRITQPLLLGFGKNYNTYHERLAKRQYRVAQLGQIMEISFALQKSITSYLKYTSANIELQIQIEMQQWMEALIEQVGYMVKMDALPEADLKYVSALIASQKAFLEEAVLKVMESRIEFGRNIGLTMDRAMELPQPLNSFYVSEVKLEDTALYIKTCIEKSKDLRMDIEMLSDYIRQAEISINYAKESSKQELNLTLGVGYNGIFESPASIEQLYQPYLQNIYGINYHIGLSIGLEPMKNKAKGELIKSLAAKDIATARVEFLLTESASDISKCLHNILSYNNITHNLKIATELSKEALDNEYVKLKLGTSTVINLAQVQINYFELLLDYYNAIYNLNVNIINLRFLTGTLVTVIDYTILEVDTDKLFMLPFIN